MRKLLITVGSLVVVVLVCLGAASIDYNTYMNNAVVYTNVMARTATITNGVTAGASTFTTANATNGYLVGAQTVITPAGGVNANASQITDLLVGGMAVSRATLTHGANVTLDCGLTNRYASCTLTGNVTFVTANLAAGKWYNVILTNPATNATPTFPAWKWLGGAPSTFTASQIGVLSIYPTSTTDATTLAAYTETQ